MSDELTKAQLVEAETLAEYWLQYSEMIHVAKTHIRQRVEIERLEAAIKKITAVGFNEDCLFCGLKDNIAGETLVKEDEST